MLEGNKALWPVKEEKCKSLRGPSPQQDGCAPAPLAPLHQALGLPSFALFPSPKVPPNSSPSRIKHPEENKKSLLTYDEQISFLFAQIFLLGFKVFHYKRCHQHISLGKELFVCVRGTLPLSQSSQLKMHTPSIPASSKSQYCQLECWVKG